MAIFGSYAWLFTRSVTMKCSQLRYSMSMAFECKIANLDAIFEVSGKYFLKLPVSFKINSDTMKTLVFCIAHY